MSKSHSFVYEKQKLFFFFRIVCQSTNIIAPHLQNNWTGLSPFGDYYNYIIITWLWYVVTYWQHWLSLRCLHVFWNLAITFVDKNSDNGNRQKRMKPSAVLLALIWVKVKVYIVWSSRQFVYMLATGCNRIESLKIFANFTTCYYGRT